MPPDGRLGACCGGGCARLGVRDVGAAIAFYTDVLGLQLAIQLGREWAALDAGGGLIIGLAPRVEGEEPGGTVSLWTGDPLESEVARLSGRGVTFDGPVVDKGVVQLAFFRDPDGNRLALTNAPPSPTSAMQDGAADRLPLFEHLGLRWIDIGATGATVEFDIRDDLRGPAGTVQGGAIATLVDVAAASTAAQSSAGLVATSELTIHFLAPGRVGPVRAVGELLRTRSGGAVVEVRVYDAGNAERLMAVALAAFSRLSGSAEGAVRAT